MRLEWTDSAIRDLRAVRAYIAEEDPRAAARTGARIVDAVEMLTTFPASGRAGRRPATRELVIPATPYIVAYRVARETVGILRVIHGARRWPHIGTSIPGSE